MSASGPFLPRTSSAPAAEAARGSPPPQVTVADFDSTSLSPREQRDVFDVFSGGLYRFSKVEDRDCDCFKVAYREIAIGDFTMAVTDSFAPFDFTREPAAIRADMRDDVSLGYRISGTNRVLSDDAQRLWTPGALVLVDMGRPARYVESRDPGSHIRFRIPRPMAAALLADVCFHNVLVKNILATLLGEHLKSIAENIRDLDSAHYDGVVEVTKTLITATLAPTKDNLMCARDPIDAGLYARACRYIDRELFSSSLTPDRIAAAVGVSRRKLYQAFEARGGVSREVMARRLDRAHEILLDGAAFSRIKQVAYALGFQSDAHFSRCFKQRFGYRPGDAAGRRGGAPVDIGPGPRAGGTSGKRAHG